MTIAKGGVTDPCQAVGAGLLPVRRPLVLI